MVVAVIGSGAIYMLFGWLLSAIIASYLSSRKGYGERPGLASGMLVPVVAPLVWVFMPARPGSDWKVIGAFGNQRKDEQPA